MKKLFKTMKECLGRGTGCVLTTIIADSGSTPRGAGAHMLTFADGSAPGGIASAGTVGGGAVEYKAQQIAAELLQSGQSAIRAFELNRRDVENLGMICGGNVRLFFQYIDPADESNLRLCREGLDAFRYNENAWMVMDITDERAWEIHICKGDGTASEEFAPLLGTKALHREINGHAYYAEPLVQAGKVYVFGGGHVSRELVPVLSHLGFSCAVFEDREEFAKAEYFPGGTEIIRGDFEDIFDKVTLTGWDYAVVMTRGHQHDYIVQRQVMEAHPRYVGVIGSKSKVKLVMEKLEADGVPMERLRSIHSPIGLDIKAETPEEIAISIAAELIMTRRDAQVKGEREELHEYHVVERVY